MISAAPHVVYIQEPFNPNINGGVNPKPFKYWFQYICEENSKEYISILDGIIRYQYALGANIAGIRNIRNAARVIRDQGLCLWHKINGDRPLIKDPIAFFSAEWLYKKYNMNVLVVIRHPAAFCSSLKIKNWEFDFNNFLKQPLLMEKYLHPFRDEIREYAENKKGLIEQAILLWNCIHNTVKIYQEKYPEWFFIKHEDLSVDPINRFQSIYKEFGVEFTRKAKETIMKNSGVHNPVEQQAGNEFIRNSRENIKNWKKRLSQEEILQIRMKTFEIADQFYSEEEW
jgi:hypothetical protein